MLKATYTFSGTKSGAKGLRRRFCEFKVGPAIGEAKGTSAPWSKEETCLKTLLADLLLDSTEGDVGGPMRGLDNVPPPP